MKIITFLFICLSFSVFSQDVIIKKNGEKIDAKVIEITYNAIKYRSWEQQDGPIRNVLIADVKEIIYNDGTWDNFEDKEIRKEETEEIVEMEPERSNPEDAIFQDGFFGDLLLGYGLQNATELVAIYDPNTGNYSTVESKVRYQHVSLSLRLGNKWYFGSRDKWRPGIQATWVRLGMHINELSPYGIIAGPKTLNPVNVGMANAFKFTDDIGLEANLTTGYSLLVDLDNGDFTHGLALTPEVKFRYKKLALGIDYMHYFGISGVQNPASWDVISLSVGAKF